MTQCSGASSCRRVFRATQFALTLCTILFAACTATAVEIVDLGTLGGTFGEATAVNAHGQVVGHSYIAGDAEFHAFSWTQTGGMIDLGTLGGGTFSEPTAVSTTGQVVGNSTTADFPFAFRAFSWTQTGGMIDIGTLGGNFSF